MALLSHGIGYCLKSFWFTISRQGVAGRLGGGRRRKDDFILFLNLFGAGAVRIVISSAVFGNYDTSISLFGRIYDICRLIYIRCLSLVFSRQLRVVLDSYRFPIPCHRQSTDTERKQSN